jgi:predicted HTH transcriptional regulator
MERIFVSSVQKEFAEERKAIRDFVTGDALLRRFFTVSLFEDLPAADRPAETVYLGEVDRCGIYLGLFGSEYGFTGDNGLSPTELEYDRATQKGKARLIFVKQGNDAERNARMRSLVAKASGQLVRRRFNTTSELTAQVYAGLVEHLVRTGHLRVKPFDAALCTDAVMADLDSGKMREFLERAQSQRGYPLGPGTTLSKALAHLNLLDGKKPNHAAMLLFGKDPQRFLPTSEVKCMHYHGVEVRKPIPSYQIYKGTVFELVDRAVDFVMSIIPRSVGTRAESVSAPVRYELPREAVAEAIVNAVAHRDYASNASVQVMLFSDRLEIWNPGELPSNLTVDQLSRPHPSIPRNPLIADPLFLARYAEKAGSGILDMFALCKAEGLRAPQFRQDGGQFVQTIWRPRVATEVRTKLGPSWDQAGTQSPTQSPTQSTDPVERLLGVLKKGPASADALRKALGIRHRPTFRSNYLHPAVKAGFIEYTIPDKPNSRLQRYRLTVTGQARLKHLERKK